MIDLLPTAFSLLLTSFLLSLISSFNGRPATFIEDEITTPIPDQPAHHVHNENDEVAAAHIHASSTLTEIRFKIMARIYGRRRRGTTNELRRSSSQLHDELWQWHGSLPNELKLPADLRASPPSVFLLQYVFPPASLIIIKTCE